MEVNPRLSIKLSHGNFFDLHTSFKNDANQEFSEASTLVNVVSSSKHPSKFPISLIPKKLEQFDLIRLRPDAVLSRNSKYLSMLELLKAYNEKLAQNPHECIVNYKFHEFIYTSLQACHSKTPTEVNLFLAKVSKFQDDIEQKRGLFVLPKKKNQVLSNDDEQVRQNFKSYLPLQIDEYRRKKFSPSFDLKKQKMGKTKSAGFNLLYDSRDEGDGDREEERKFSKRLEEDQEETLEQLKMASLKKQREAELPNLRIYRTQVLKMKKNNQDKEDRNILQAMKRNQAQLHSLTAVNFYKGMPNPKDIFTRTNANFSTNEHILRNTQGSNISQSTNQMQETFANNFGQTMGNSWFSQTAQSFNDIKRKRTLDIMNQTKKIAFSNSNNKENMMDTQKTDEDSGNENENVQITPVTMPTCIDGMNLIKNPFAVTKAKKGKKKK